MAAAVDTESGHFFDAVCFRLEQPRGCAGALLLGLAMALTAGAGAVGNGHKRPYQGRPERCGVTAGG